MRRGFTMIELIFVIVILGILASIAIPRLAASRDDARAVSIKSDIGTLQQAVPAWYQGQSEISIENALSFDTSIWIPKSDTEMEYTYYDKTDHATAGTVVARVIAVDVNNSADNMTDAERNTPIAKDATTKAATATAIGSTQVPWLYIELNKQPTGIVHVLIDDLKVPQNASVAMAGKRVVWN